MRYWRWPTDEDLINAANLAIEESLKSGRLVFEPPVIDWPAPNGYQFTGEPVVVTFDAIQPEQAALIRADRDCRVYWGSHGCHLERGHSPDDPCRCCCECANHPDPDSGCVGAHPYYGPDTRFYGEDVAARGLPDVRSRWL